MTTETTGTGDGPACWNCSSPLPDLLRPVSRHEYCPHCAEPVHCCRMCRHFAPALPEQCREDRAEHPTDRTAANFCDFFTLRETAPGGVPGASGASDAAKARLDALFGGAGGSEAGSAAGHDERQSRARSRLDELFGDDKGGGDD